MARVEADQVVPCLVVHLDTDRLRQLGACQTNAELTAKVDRAVQGPHYFLILSVDQAAGTCLAVPLYSDAGPGSEPLDDTKKTGLADKWANQTSYFSRWQHWRIPITSIPEVSGGEESTPANRRMYSAIALGHLAPMAAWVNKNRNAFRGV